MNRLVRNLSSSLPLLRQPELGILRSGKGAERKEWSRGIRVGVRDGNLEQALAIMQRKMTSSGMEHLIKRQVGHHIKNSEKRVLARKNLELRLRSQDLARKLRDIIVKKISWAEGLRYVLRQRSQLRADCGLLCLSAEGGRDSDDNCAEGAICVLIVTGFH